MAKKDKENEFEDLSSGDINEADDSFGLPEIDYEPLKEPEEVTSDATGTPEIADDPKEEQAAESSDEAFMYANREEDQNASSSDEGGFSASAEEPEEESVVNIFGGTSEEEASTDPEPENVPEEKEYVPGSYTPKHSSGSNIGAIIAIVLVIILAGVGIWYFMFERPRQAEIAAQEQAERERNEQLQREREAEAAAERRRQEEEAARLAEEQRLAEEKAASEPGTIETISSRTGRYYVIVTSSIDGDLAMDYARELADKGNSVKIIAPYGNVKFHRVAVTDVETLAEADSKANELKAEYGDGVWVMRY